MLKWELVTLVSQFFKAVVELIPDLCYSHLWRVLEYSLSLLTTGWPLGKGPVDHLHRASVRKSREGVLVEVKIEMVAMPRKVVPSLAWVVPGLPLSLVEIDPRS